ncbi:hypothetical protein LX32DRAFT_291998 [Colletotrichum zoysiae]|uniref:Uncharacterized protein n=1 Tax=Colletotrichum zoysiae TaxID=1216348 RepID=A0AAD9LUF1_9PEZI|nr:hypothetical protein LX32DRAFT_291998 [Colletotrichum zoysiae]
MPDFVVSNVVAVRQDEGQPPEIIPQQFELRVRLSQQKLLLFCLIASFAPDGASASKSTIYLQFTADSLHPLHRVVYNKINPNPRDPSCLDHVWKLLQDTKNVTCLQFQLRSGRRIQLAVPLDFNPEKITDNTIQSAFRSAESLAAASSFSLYFRADALRRRSLREYNAAIRRPLTEELVRSYKDMLDVKRLYNGIGGKAHEVHISRGHRDGSPRTRESCSSPTSAASTVSCGSTLPFDTVPRPPESPPSYEEYLNEGQSPRVGPDAAATVISTKGLADNLAPPEYGDTEQPHDVLDPKGVPCGSQDINKHLTTKRKRSVTSICTTRIVATDASQPKKELQKHVENLQAQVKRLEKRHDDLEGDCCMLQKRQDEIDDDVNNLQVDVDELGNTCENLGNSMLDVCDEFNDLKDTMRGTPEADQCKWSENMAKELGEYVRAEADEIKRKICQALQ